MLILVKWLKHRYCLFQVLGRGGRVLRRVSQGLVPVRSVIARRPTRRPMILVPRGLSLRGHRIASSHSAEHDPVSDLRGHRIASGHEEIYDPVVDRLMALSKRPSMRPPPYGAAKRPAMNPMYGAAKRAALEEAEWAEESYEGVGDTDWADESYSEWVDETWSYD